MKSLRQCVVLAALLLGTALFVLSCEDDDGPQLRTLNFIDIDLHAGRFVIPWATNFPSGKLVPAGSYTFKMTSGTYSGKVVVQVKAGAPDVISGCDSAYQTGGSLPNAYDITTNASIFAPGDTVCITYSLPAAGHVRIDITYWE